MNFGYTVLGFGSGVSGGAVFTAATGGTVSTDGNTKIHTFNSSGDFIISQVGVDDDQVSVELAGGGSGGVGTYNGSPTTLSATGSGGNTTAQGLTANGASGASGSGSGSGQAFGTQGSISGNGGGSKSCAQIGCGGGGQGNTGSGGGAGGYRTGGGGCTLGKSGYAASYAADLDFTGTVATRAVVIGAGSSGTGHTNGGCGGNPSNSHGAKGGDGQVVFKYTYQ